MSWLITEDSDKTIIGAKAKHLFGLQQHGFNVPQFVVLPLSYFQSTNAQKFTELLTEINGCFKADTKFAVRSSSGQEDGTLHSFAGQFDTFLNVSESDLEDKINLVFESINSERVKGYRKANGLKSSTEIAVVIQQMVEADVSLVAFSRNPNQITANEKIITATYGLGEGLVSGDLLADVYHSIDGEVKATIASKQHKYITSQTGVKKVEVDKSLIDLPALSTQQINEVIKALDKAESAFKSPQDLELSYVKNELYFLQSRPITTHVNNTKPKGEYILWDNSNIIESYPGITSPLTFSFIEKMYSKVYSQLAQVMGVSKQQVNHQKNVFDNTLGSANGRVYYNLLSWYKMLAMVPGYSLNARFMEKMMGVKERFDLTENYKMSKAKAWFRTFVMVFKMIGLQIRLPKDRVRFTKFVSGVFEEYQNYDYKNMSDVDMIKKYLKLEDILLNSWKAPLVNDFFTMIWFGLLEKNVKKILPEHPNLHNDILCGSHNIISVEPLHCSFKIVEIIKANPLA